jgi:hypothetical protein
MASSDRHFAFSRFTCRALICNRSVACLTVMYPATAFSITFNRCNSLWLKSITSQDLKG